MHTLQNEELRLAREAVEEKIRLQKEMLTGDSPESLVSALEAQKSEAAEILKESTADAEKTAAALVTSTEESQQAALEILEKYYPEWQDAGKKMSDYVQYGLEQNSYKLETGLYDMGAMGILGFTEGFLSGEQRLIEEASRIAEGMRSAIQSTLEIESPSKALMRDGKNTGLGFVMGIESVVPLAKRVASSLGNAARTNETYDLTSNLKSDSAVKSHAESPAIHISIGQFVNNRESDIEQLAEEIATYATSKLAGKGIL